MQKFLPYSVYKQIIICNFAAKITKQDFDKT